MNVVKIFPASLSGTLTAPSSKSFSHRAIICGAMANCYCSISPIVFSDDVNTTIEALKEIGANINKYKDSIEINGFKSNQDRAIINCHDSGSTLRFLIPIVAALGINAVFKRSISLARRPILEYLNILSKSGIKFKYCSDLSLKVSGKLSSGKFLVPGDITSQFISGLLMALPLLQGDSEIELKSELKSHDYVNITIEVMKDFGVYVQKTNNGFFIKGRQKYKREKYIIEGDWSQAAFFMASGAIKEYITVKNLNKESSQGDKKILKLLSNFGAKVSWQGNHVTIKNSKLKGININASEIPDLVPILAVVAANAEGTTNIVGVERLKFKECNRLKAIYKQLKILGIDVKISNGNLIIRGNDKYKSGAVWSHKDHRIAMALSIMAINLPKGIMIIDADSVNKSYPHFFKDYNSLGGKAIVIKLGE